MHRYVSTVRIFPLLPKIEVEMIGSQLDAPVYWSTQQVLVKCGQCTFSTNSATPESGQDATRWGNVAAQCTQSSTEEKKGAEAAGKAVHFTCAFFYTFLKKKHNYCKSCVLLRAAAVEESV